MPHADQRLRALLTRPQAALIQVQFADNVLWNRRILRGDPLHPQLPRRKRERRPGYRHHSEHHSGRDEWLGNVVHVDGDGPLTATSTAAARLFCSSPSSPLRRRLELAQALPPKEHASA